MSSPVASPSSYRNFDASNSTAATCTTNNNNIVCEVMSPPVYRTGSQKHRRRVIQLSEPPICELDQLTYNATTTNNNTKQSSTSSSLSTSSSSSSSRIINNNRTAPFYSNYQLHSSSSPSPSTTTSSPELNHVHMPPTALTSSSRYVTDTFSILTSTSSQPKEIDMCEKRYSMMYHRQQPTPPPSPPSLPTSLNTTATTAVTTMEQNIPAATANVKEMLASPMSPMDERSILSLSNASTSTTTIPQEDENKNLSDFSSEEDSSCSSDSEEYRDEEEDMIAAEQSTPSPVSNWYYNQKKHILIFSHFLAYYHSFNILIAFKYRIQ